MKGKSLLTDNLKIFGFLKQQVKIAEVLGDQKLRVSHEVQNVSEHVAIAIDEIMLLQGVENDWDASIEKFCKS